MSGKKHFAVISSQMDRAEKQAEKAANNKDVTESKKVEESSDTQSQQIPLDGDIPIFTEEFLNYNKGIMLVACYLLPNKSKLEILKGLVALRVVGPSS